MKQRGIVLMRIALGPDETTPQSEDRQSYADYFIKVTNEAVSKGEWDINDPKTLWITFDGECTSKSTQKMVAQHFLGAGWKIAEWYSNNKFKLTKR